MAAPLPTELVFSRGSPEPREPKRHSTDGKRAWSELPTRAEVMCRLHDLRRTFATDLAEEGAAETTMLGVWHSVRSI